MTQPNLSLRRRQQRKRDYCKRWLAPSLWTVCTHVSCVQGFSEWSRRDFNQFVRMCGEYGRDDLDSICKEVEGKTEEEVWFH